jgi:hypothetical protein
MFRSPHNPPATQEKWEFGSRGIAEVNNPSTSYFVTSITTPSATADPTALVFYTRTRNKVYKTTDGAAFWSKFWESPQVQTGTDANGNPIMSYTRVVRAGSHPVGVNPETVDRVAILLNSGYAVFTIDGGLTWTEKLLTTLAHGHLRRQRIVGSGANAGHQICGWRKHVGARDDGTSQRADHEAARQPAGSEHRVRGHVDRRVSDD